MDKQAEEKRPKYRHINRLACKAIVVIVTIVIVIATGVTGCQQKSSLNPSAPVTLMPNSASATPQRPISPSQGSISPTPPLRPTAGGTDAFVIRLQSRQFVPEAEVQSGLNWLHTVPYGRVHVLLQLYEPPDSAARTLLEQSGILLLNYIPSNAWFASIPSTLQLDDPAIILIRWFGPILPEDKLPAELFGGSIGDWALREGNRVALEVAFFEDVDLDDGRQLLLKYDATVIGSTPLSNKVTVEILKDSILSLATEDVVRWIDVVPPPPATNEYSCIACSPGALLC